MTINGFKKIQQIIKIAISAIEKEALENGEIVSDTQREQLEFEIVERTGTPYREYQGIKELIKQKKTAKREAEKEQLKKDIDKKLEWFAPEIEQIKIAISEVVQRKLLWQDIDGKPELFGEKDAKDAIEKYGLKKDHIPELRRIPDLEHKTDILDYKLEETKNTIGNDLRQVEEKTSEKFKDTLKKKDIEDFKRNVEKQLPDKEKVGRLVSGGFVDDLHKHRQPRNIVFGGGGHSGEPPYYSKDTVDAKIAEAVSAEDIWDTGSGYINNKLESYGLRVGDSNDFVQLWLYPTAFGDLAMLGGNSLSASLNLPLIAMSGGLYIVEQSDVGDTPGLFFYKNDLSDFARIIYDTANDRLDFRQASNGYTFDNPVVVKYDNYGLNAARSSATISYTNSTITTDGSIALGASYVSLDLTLNVSRHLVLCELSPTISLPEITRQIHGRKYTIKNIGTGVVTVQVAPGSGQLIDGTSSWTIDNQYDSMQVMCIAEAGAIYRWNII